MASADKNSKSKKVTVKKGSAEGINIIKNNIIVRPVNRSKKDIANWRNAHRAAENSVMGSRVELYDLYADAELDPHLSSVIDKRLMAVTNVKIRFVKDGKDVEGLAKLLKSKEFKYLLKEILKAKLWGISLLENSFNPYKVYSVPRKHIRPLTGIISYEQSGSTGFSYKEGMFLNTMMEIGEPDDFGLILKAIPYVLYKRGCMGDWAQFTEIFGMPMRVGRYSGYDQATRLALEKALDEAGASLSVVLPEEAKLEILESNTTTGSAEIYRSLIDLCDEQLSILILGQTETTKSSQSSGYAQSKTHAKTEDDINKDDRAYVISYLDTAYTHVLTQAGFPMEGGEWIFEDEDENLTLKERVLIDTTLKESGLPIDDDYFYERYNIPKPANYKELKEKNNVNPPPDAAEKKKPKKTDLALSDELLQKMSDFFG